MELHGEIDTGLTLRNLVSTSQVHIQQLRWTNNPLSCFKSSPEIIRFTVTMYFRYPLSSRHVKDPRFERGIGICDEVVRFWWNRFSPLFAIEIRKRRAQHRVNSNG